MEMCKKVKLLSFADMEKKIKTKIEFISLDDLKSVLMNQIVVLDKKVYIHYRSLFSKTERFLFTPNEDNKNLYTVRKIYSFLDKINAVRTDTVYSTGGGITTDIGGFAAATFKRGMKSVLIPTTLLSMVDAAVGGKTGVNFRGSKNLVGVFNQPEKVYICMDFLKSLSEKQIGEGLAEILKIGIVAGKHILKDLSGENISEDIIRKAIELKISVCEQDVYDHSARMMLNFGHTFAHAVEKASGYSVSHGNAVSYGMITAIEISEKLGLLKSYTSEEMKSLMKGLNLDYQLSDEIAARLLKKCDHYFLKDKKKSNYIRFVLLEDLEKPLISNNNQESEIIELFKAKLGKQLRK